MEARDFSRVRLHKTFETVGASGLLLMIYVPQIAYLLAYWLVVRPMPIMDWQKETLGFRKTAEIFLMMYAVSGVINQIGAAITKTAPAGGTPQLEALSTMQTTKLPVGIMIPVIIGPILEELIFRKLMIDRTRGYGEKTAIFFQRFASVFSMATSRSFYMPAVPACFSGMSTARPGMSCIQCLYICC